MHQRNPYDIRASRPKPTRTINKLNRSSKLPPVKSYDDAKKVSTPKEEPKVTTVDYVKG